MVEKTRTLGFRVAFALGLGTMIAAGIFSLSGTAVHQIGSSAVIAFVIAALVASITAAAYSEFASIYSENGGGYLFTSRTFEERDHLTYAIGASLFLGYTGTTAFYLATMDEWFFRFILPAGTGEVLPHGTVGVAAALALGFLNARGTEESGTFQVLVTAAKVAVLLVFIGGAIAFAGPGQAATEFSGGFQNEPVGILSVAALAFITFFGFSAIAASAGEIIEPKNTVPKAIAASIVTVTVLYVFVIVAMVNAPVPDAVLAEGETAMGRVAASFLGPAGQWLIVAGAVFSMISASNASILAASGIGSLMGRRGHAPRRFSRIHPVHNTPYFSVMAATGTIAALILGFITLFGHGGLVSGLGLPELGLAPLTGFATFNLLVPLSVVNLTLIYSRRNFPDLTRGFRMPLVPYLPVLGVLANLALIYKLPADGVVIGVVVTLLTIGAFLAWGGQPEESELVAEAAGERQVMGTFGDTGATATALSGTAGEAGEGEDVGQAFTVLVPVADIDNARSHVRMAARIGHLHDDRPTVKVLNIVDIPDQADSSAFLEEASTRMERLEAVLEPLVDELDADVLAEGHVSKDVAFDILKTAREDEVERILMGIPEEHPEITSKVEYEAPCDVLFVQDVSEETDLSRITIGAGGGPHHNALLDLADRLGDVGSRIDVVHVYPSGEHGVAEDIEATLEVFDEEEDVHVHEVASQDIARVLVEEAEKHDALLAIGATRNRLLRQWVFGSTADRVVAEAARREVPVVVYTSAEGGGFSGRLDELLFWPYRYVLRYVS